VIYRVQEVAGDIGKSDFTARTVPIPQNGPNRLEQF